ncbi:hypothetical protein [Enterobacillus tribolii]|uniref:Uncharacterized protein n=1 Tax=Enterobacillus tribolii TaxID=1487935 RepID=A0A370QTS4_9GAMM|nr:hypothetical protein [Enterobacillus tribolii]MBW7981280.1 hypothetical protein [Enterobacillus tribolii]RDK92657.1 hypothetical protein C8D90_10347 [Enterobacillus tribolii]
MKAWWLAFGLWAAGLRGPRFPLLLAGSAVVPAVALLLLGKLLLSAPLEERRETIDRQRNALTQLGEENRRLEAMLAQLRRETPAPGNGPPSCQALPGSLASGQVKSWRRENASPAQWSVSLSLAYPELTALLTRLEPCPWLIQLLRITRMEQGVEAEIRLGEAA